MLVIAWKRNWSGWEEAGFGTTVTFVFRSFASPTMRPPDMALEVLLSLCFLVFVASGSNVDTCGTPRKIPEVKYWSAQVQC